ncbi:MAG: hypothetical protein ABWW69_07625 [Pyrodictiaceae archaeon]
METSRLDLCRGISKLIVLEEARLALIDFMLEKNFSVVELSRIMGVSPAAVSRYKSHSLVPSITSVCKLIKYVYDYYTELFNELVKRLLILNWNTIISVIDFIDNVANVSEDVLKNVLDLIADDVARLIAKYFSKTRVSRA